MNKRLQELAQQSYDYADGLGLGGDEWCDAQMKKFAELIVQECATIADRERPNILGCGYVTKTKGMLIKEHFGVDK